MSNTRPKPRIVVTSGKPYLDIDGYAGCVAYAELLRTQGHTAIAASTSPLNESVPSTLRSLKAEFETDYQSVPNDVFALIDVSDPDHFDRFVNLDHVVEVIDHHVGFEKYWSERPCVKLDVEFIGAACTQIYERWQRAGLLNQMSETSTKLLMAGILDNTLNFGASVTTDRDRTAYKDLRQRTALTDDWPAQYFTECERTILGDFEAAVLNDSKVLKFEMFEHAISVGQLVIWDAGPILNQQQAIKRTLQSKKPNWFMNVISLKDRCSYVITDDQQIQVWLSNLLGLEFHRDVAKAGRLWLRKEIIKRDLELGRETH